MKIIETCPRCGHDLIDIVIATNPPIPRKECLCCGWSWEGEPEKVIRVPFGGNSYISDEVRLTPIQPSSLGYESSPCTNCSSNPKNGGSGICFCTLGLPKIT